MIPQSARYTRPTVRELSHALGRNRRLIALFGLMVVLPAVIFGVLIVRAIRSDRLQLEYETSQRQRQVVRLVEADLNAWLFSAGPDSARQQALLKFRVERDVIAFPDFNLTLPTAEAERRRPFETQPTPEAPTTESVVTLYYPRILAFLRDFGAGRHAGAQHFLRLRAVVVRPPGQADGYVIEIGPVIDHVNRRLAEFCAAERFTGSVWIADPGARSPATIESYALQNYPFFAVMFKESNAASSADFRRYAFVFSMSLLVAITVLGSLFVHRAVSHEVRLSNLRKDFVAAVSHEFRSPLSSILLLAERLESDKAMSASQLREYHRIIGHDARRLAALVTRLLEFAQIEEGKKTYSCERIELVDAAREAVDSTTSAERVRFSGADAAPLWVDGDRTALCHAIQNLIENAAKYSPRDAPIDVVCASTNGSNVVEVRDRGIGIPPSEHERIFEKFYRGRQVSDLNVPGVGIGLALVKHVVESHGGSVAVRSQPGEGSSFALRLPKAEG